MARYTLAYSSFIGRLREVEILRLLAVDLEKTHPVTNRDEINALCRGSVVLLSSHLEAFVKELGEIALDSLYTKSVTRENLSSRFFYHISKEFVDELKNTGDPDSIAEKIFEFLKSDEKYWSRTGTFSSTIPTLRFNKGFSNPAYKKIKAYFNRFGYNQFSHELAVELKSNFLPTVNLINHLVDTRNRIAHGDPSATKTPSEVKTMSVFVRRFCIETDKLFASWWKNEFCAIR